MLIIFKYVVNNLNNFEYFVNYVKQFSLCCKYFQYVVNPVNKFSICCKIYVILF